MSCLFGLNIGNSSACLAAIKDGRSNIVANDAGDRVTKTVVHWTPCVSIVGKTAELEAIKHPGSVITRNKQLLNLDISEPELESLRSQLPYKINSTGVGLKYELLYLGRQHHIFPLEICTTILRTMRKYAESAVSKSDSNIQTVLCVPPYFSQASIEKVVNAAYHVGFSVIQVIDETSAAVLGSEIDINPDIPKFTCLVYRLGGVSMDVSVVDIEHGMISIIDTLHKYDVGGKYFTNELCTYLCKEFMSKYKVAKMTERGVYKLNAAAETMKQILSVQALASCSVESADSGYDFNSNISRARFENLISQQVVKCLTPVEEVLRKCSLTHADIKKVIVCGGSMKIIKIQESLRSMFPQAEMVGDKQCDELVAKGASIQAGLVVKSVRIPTTLSHEFGILTEDVSIKVGVEPELKTFLIKSPACLPVSEKYHYELSSQENVIQVLIGLNVLCTVPLESTEGTVIVEITKRGLLLLKIRNKNLEIEDSHVFHLGTPEVC